MAYYSRLFFLYCILAFPAGAFAQYKTIGLEKAAPWVIEKNAETVSSVNLNEVGEGYYYLLFDNQRNLEESVSYSHFALKIVSDAGAENASQITIDYNPEYEELILHKIELIRNGQRMNRLDMKKIKTLQRETDLERNIYDGSYTAMLILEDVRKGDIVEYSYSKKGRNPVFTDKFSTWFYTQFSSPVAEFNYLVICSSSRKMKIKEFNGAIKPLIKTDGNKTIYEWHGVNLKPLIVDDRTPDWLDPYSYIMMSEFDGWKGVKAWAQGLFHLDDPLSKELKDTVTAIEKRALTKDGKVIAAARFVQNQIRYMGIEIGVYSHLPNTPNRVFAQRFGDCKDKSQLLCRMLREMGIEANPALINTSEKDELPNTLPNPHSFNHCTVQVKVDGETYWIDPTISYQCGTLKTNAYPDYRWALVVTDTSSGLTKIPNLDKGRVRITEEFDMANFDGQASLTVTSVYEGDEADDIRYQMANNSIKELEEDYKNFYAKLYPKIRLRDSLKTEDDPNLNKYTVTEYYTIDGLWVHDSTRSTTKIKASFEALLMESYIHTPKIRIRKMPIAIHHPVNVHQSIQIKLPEDWNVNQERGTLSTSAFDYNYNYSFIGHTVYLEYDYQTKKDFIPVEEVDDFLKTVDNIYDHVSYNLTYDTGNVEASVAGTGVRSNTNWSLISFLLFYFCVAGYVFYRLYFLNAGVQLYENGGPAIPAAFGGWLIVVLILLVYRPFIYVVQLLTAGYFDSEKASRMAAKNEYWIFVMNFEVIANATMLLFSIFLLVLFLSYRSSLPRFYIVFLILSLLLTLLDILFTSTMLNKSIGFISKLSMGTGMLYCSILIPYFLMSERVKQTFVVRYKDKNETY